MMRKCDGLESPENADQKQIYSVANNLCNTCKCTNEILVSEKDY